MGADAQGVLCMNGCEAMVRWMLAGHDLGLRLDHLSAVPPAKTRAHGHVVVPWMRTAYLKCTTLRLSRCL